MGSSVLVSVGDGLAVSVGESVGLSVAVAVGVGDHDQPGDVLGAVPDGPVAGWVSEAEGVGEGQAVGVGGSADETAAAMLEVGVGCAVALVLLAGWHFDAADAREDAVPAALGPALAVPWEPFVIDPPPDPDGAPLPSVPPPPVDWPPVSTLLVTCPMAARSDGTATVTIAMKAIAASTPAGRSQLVPVAHPPADRAAGRCRWRAWLGDGGMRDGEDEAACQAQCPLHIQYRARLTAPLTTLSSHGCGGRRRVLARMRSSASAPGSTAPTATVSSRRSRVSRSPRGTVMRSPPRPPGSRPLAAS